MIGLITINDYSNLGNRLQNYAMYHILNKYDKTYNIVRFYGCETKKNYPSCKNSFFCEIYRKFKTSIKIIFRKKPFIYERERNKNFLEFNKNIKNGETLSYDTDYFALNKKYDYFVTGSDQVWNPTFPGNGMYINMLGFTESSKKIAVSPSIAIDSLSSEQQEEFKRYLTDFKALSCREEKGADLISTLVDRECFSLLDPTLMLEPGEWDAISKKPKWFRRTKSFILVYFLGEITADYRRLIFNISQKYDLDVINIMDKNSKFYSCGPAEFIWVVKHSSLVLTDSFHGAVFSFIYERPFKIFNREDKWSSMNSRITNLIDKLHLENVLVNTKIDDDYLFYINKKDYLIEEQKKFEKYIVSALSNNV